MRVGDDPPKWWQLILAFVAIQLVIVYLDAILTALFGIGG